MLTLLEVLQRTTQFLADKGVADAKLNAELLIGHVLGLRRLDLYLQFERPLEERVLAELRLLVRRRGQREPLQYLTSPIPFGPCAIKADARALVPRPETEFLFERIVEHLGDHKPQRILDLGTGSGALALALAKTFSAAEVLASDCSKEALALAAENAELNALAGRIDFRRGDWLQPFQGEAKFDLIVSNPPYLTPEELASAEAEVARHDPQQALLSGVDGLDALRVIVQGAKTFLNPGALLALETGIAHREALASCFADGDWDKHWGEDDLSGRQRFYFAIKA